MNLYLHIHMRWSYIAITGLQTPAISMAPFSGTLIPEYSISVLYYPAHGTPYLSALPSPLLAVLNIVSPATGLTPLLPLGLPPGLTLVPLVPMPLPLLSSRISSSFFLSTSSVCLSLDSSPEFRFRIAMFSLRCEIIARSMAVVEALVWRILFSASRRLTRLSDSTTLFEASWKTFLTTSISLFEYSNFFSSAVFSAWCWRSSALTVSSSAMAETGEASRAARAICNSCSRSLRLSLWLVFSLMRVSRLRSVMIAVASSLAFSLLMVERVRENPSYRSWRALSAAVYSSSCFWVLVRVFCSEFSRSVWATLSAASRLACAAFREVISIRASCRAVVREETV